MQFLFRQTRTRVHSAPAERAQREKGWISAARAMAAVQLGTQLVLWVFFYGYDLSAQAVWQAALMLLAPLTVLWIVWRNAAVDHPAAKWILLPLLLCLIADAVFMITALGGFVSQLVPHYPSWVGILLPAAFCWLTALCARPRGVRYGSALLIVPLIALLVISTIFLRASSRADRLWPILGDGLLSTARSALSGAGAAWGAALLFVLTEKRRQPWKAAGWYLLPWVVCVICALWFGFLKPWLPGDDIAIAEKMLGLSRHAHSVILYEMSGVMWMLLVPASLAACFSTGGEIISRVFPRLPLWATLLAVPVLAAAAVLLWTENIFAILGTILSWRWVLSLLCGLGLLILNRRRA